MGILTRFKDIMASNINALLDRAEDPQKMIDQYLRELEEDMAKVKMETASVMADEKAAKRDLDKCNEEAEKMLDYAKRAVSVGNDADAKQFLQKKADLSSKQEVLRKKYDIAAENSRKMREIHDKLESDIDSLKNRRDTLKIKAQVTETQAKMNRMGSGAADAGATIAAFDRMEDKVNRMLDAQDAMAELNEDDADSTEDLMRKYEQKEESDIDGELAALKAEMGM